MVKKGKLREILKDFPQPLSEHDGLGHAHFSDFFHQPLAGGGLFLLTHDTRLFVVLTLFHFRENTSLLHLLLEAAQCDVEIIIVFV